MNHKIRDLEYFRQLIREKEELMSRPKAVFATHDPMCPEPMCGFDCRITGYHDCPHDCQCDLIARVRKDERAAALRDAVEAVKARAIMCARPAWEMEVVIAAIEALSVNAVIEANDGERRQ